MPISTKFQGNVTGKKSFGQTVAQSFRVVGGSDVLNYSIFFIDPTTRNKAGSSETIVMPYIEIGRGSTCAVQYGDEYATVGRKHAAIRYENGALVLKHLHATNPTLVRTPYGGVQQLTAMGQECPLENGSEVQFSYNGPTLRINSSNPTHVSKMGITQRVQLAVSQGVRPYKNALMGLTAALLLAVAGGGYIMNNLSNENDRLKTELKKVAQELADAKNDYDRLVKSGKASRQQLAAAQARISGLEAKHSTLTDQLNARPTGAGQTYSVAASNPQQGVTQSGGGEVSDATLGAFKNSIYFIYPKKVYVSHPHVTFGKVEEIVEDIPLVSWSGTAFLTTEGKLVTARHVIEPWRFPDNCLSILTKISRCELGGTVKAVYSILSPDGEEEMEFESDQVVKSATQDVKLDNPCPNIPQVMKCPDSGMYTDWAYVNLNKRGNITMDRELSKNLKASEQLEILGYSQGLKFQDRNKPLEPLYGKCDVAQSGLNNKIIRVSGRSFEGGASGGPVFAKKDGRYVCVGIISHGFGSIGGIIPVAHLH